MFYQQILIIEIILAFGVCLITTPIVRHFSIKNGRMAAPVKERWHKKRTALFGGIAIYVGMALPLFLISDFSQILPPIETYAVPVPRSSLPTILWIGASMIFFLGLLDDFIQIKPYTKLVGQILVASLMAFCGFRLQWFTSLTLDTVVTIVWIVGITNAFNLIDNMDGLCAGVGLLASLYLAALYWPALPQAAEIALFLAGALAAFLIYNFHPASIFMGDCGSLVIGFMMAMLTLNYSQSLEVNPLASVAVPMMVLMVPLLDTTLVTLIRLLSGRRASVGGRDHTSHRLVLVGFSERGAVLFLYGIGIISGISAIFVSRTDTLTSPAVIIPLLLAAILMGIYLAQLRVYPEREFCLLRERAYTPILLELTYKRQILLVILDFWLIAFSYYLAYRLRFSGTDFIINFRIFLHSLPAVIACKSIAFFGAGIYRGFWRYLSTDDVFGYLKASSFATLLTVAAVTFIYRFEDFTKGIFVIDWLITTALLLGTRGSFRIALDLMKRKTLSGDSVIIYGAGRGGEILLREIINNKKHRVKPLGFIDDDPLKKGKKLQGYPILGTFGELESIYEKKGFGGMVISFNSGREIERMADVKEFCKAKGLFLKQFTICLNSVDIEL